MSRGFSSILDLPRLNLAVSPEGTAFTLPYSKTLAGPEPLTFTLRATTAFADGVERAPTIVRYYVNGDQVGESDAAPDFAFDWDAGSLHDAGSTAITETFTLMADAVDPYLERSYAVDVPVKVSISWGAKPLVPQIEEEARAELVAHPRAFGIGVRAGGSAVDLSCERAANWRIRSSKARRVSSRT